MQKGKELQVSKVAENIIGSEIIKLAAEVKNLIAQGNKIYNLTIGDFDPQEFPIPKGFEEEIIKSYQAGNTNYPLGNGVLELREGISNLLKTRGGVDYSAEEILVVGGARPIIYGVYSAIVDPGDTVVFSVPSWNNNHYTFLHHAKPYVVEGKPEDNFMPSAEGIHPAIKEAALIALCSPQNPTGTVFTKKGLEDICDLILEENKRRGDNEKPVYLMYDQIYWELTMEGTTHYNPVVLRPEMRDYTIFVDGLSKSLSATGVRLGWCFGPQKVIDKMKSINTHVGAWAAKAEQIAFANYIKDLEPYSKFIEEQKQKIYTRLNGVYQGFEKLKEDGYPVFAIAPQAAIYLTIQLDLIGKTTAEGKVLAETKDVTDYVLKEGKLAVVPFSSFGADANSTWYRLSIGTLKVEDIDDIIECLRKALGNLN